MKKFLTILTAAAMLTVCQAEAAKKPAEPTGCKVKVDTDPDGAMIFVDGHATDLSDLTLNNVPDGNHIFTAVKEGFVTQRQSLKTRSGQSLVVNMKLEPLTGLILVHSEPVGAEITVDGASRGKTPQFIPDLKIGKYRLKLTFAGYKPKETDIEVTGRKPVKYNITLAADSANLMVSSTPTGAQITINGGDRGVTPTTISKLPSGDYMVELSMNGYESARQAIKLTSGKDETISAELKAIPAELKIFSDPVGAKVYFENQPHGNTPATIKDLKPGSYRVRVENTGYEPLARNITIKPADRISEEFKLEKNSGTIEITTEPAGVKVMLNGKEAGVTKAKPGEADTLSQVFSLELVKPGEHELKFVRKGYFTKAQKITVENGKTIPVQESLKRKFIPDIEVSTSKEVYKGMLIDTAEDGTIRVETKPGVIKKISKSDIISQKPIIMESKEE